jgi:hypothetical protein
MTESEQIATAQAVLAKLREDEADLTKEISYLNARLEITKEIIKALSGERKPGRPKGPKKNSSDADAAEAGAAENPA